MRPLAFDLLDETQTTYAKKRLLTALEHYHWRLGTGFLSTPLILDVLADIDLEAAYRLLENEEIPGWLSMPKNGATTIWEAWEGPNSQHGGIGSLNHYSKGAVVAWLFETMCGIRVEGENHFILAPHPGGHFYPCQGVLQQRLRQGGKRLGENAGGLEIHCYYSCQLHRDPVPARKRSCYAGKRNLFLLR